MWANAPCTECVAVHPSPMGEGTGERMYDAYTPGAQRALDRAQVRARRAAGPPSNSSIYWPPWSMRPKAGLPS